MGTTSLVPILQNISEMESNPQSLPGHSGATVLVPYSDSDSDSFPEENVALALETNSELKTRVEDSSDLHALDFFSNSFENNPGTSYSTLGYPELHTTTEGETECIMDSNYNFENIPSVSTINEDSESDYNPMDQEESEDERNEDLIENDNDTQYVQSPIRTEVTDQPQESSATTTDPSPIHKRIIVLKNNNLAQNNKVIQRVYDKKDACLYCSKLVSKLGEHLNLLHINEIEVAKVFAMPKKSRERRIALQSLRNKGNFLHNKKVVDNKTGVLLTKKRPLCETESGQYVPCEFCLGFYRKSNLARHYRKCILNPLSSSREKQRINSISRGELILKWKNNDTISEDLKTILKNMRNDKVSLVLRNDDLILKYGDSLCEKYHGLKHLKNDIAQKMRELGRLMIALESDETIKNLRDALHPQKFSSIVKAVKQMCSLDGDNSRKPTLALKIGYSLQKCAGIVKSEAIVEGNDSKKILAENFQTLYDIHWTNSISKRAVELMDKAKWNKPSLIPIANDVKKLNDYILKEENDMYETMTSGNPTEDDYRHLCQITLAHLIVFNRKRVGEVERMTRSIYLQKICNEKPQGEIEESLSACEKLLVKNMSLVYIRGKRGRKVPLLMTPKMCKHLDAMLVRRDIFNVPPENDYMFARPNSNSFYRGADALRFVATQCGAEKPENLTSTRLRKHIATVSQILNLSKNDIEQIAKHMGHSKEVHKLFYRLPDNTLELAKMTKLLMLFENGNVTPGKNLDDMTPDIDFDSELSEEELSDDSSTEDRALISPYSASKSHGEMVRKGKDQAPSIDLPREKTQQKSLLPKKNKNATWGYLKNKKKHFKKESWKEEQNQVVERFFQKDIVRGIVPGKRECDQCIDQNECLKGRTWVMVKSKVKNIITSKKKKA